MMNRIKKIWNAGISYKGVAIFLLFIFLVSLWPIFRISYYIHPSADDFTYGLAAHQTFLETGSVLKTIESAIDTVRMTYQTWQGTFSSVFLMALNPAVFNEGIYWITPFIILSALFAGILYFMWILLTKIFGFEKWSSFSFSILLMLASIQNFYWPSQGIYWYNASIHYTFMYGLMLLMLGAQLHSLFVPKKGRQILLLSFASVCALFCGGASFPIALISVMFNICILCYAVFVRKRNRIGVSIPLFINFVAFIISIMAPGNKVRQMYYEQMNPLAAIKSAMEYMFVAEYSWFTVALLLILVLSLPIAWKMSSTSKFDFRLPGLVSVLSYLCCAAMATPSFYSTSAEPLARVINAIRLMYHLLIFINVFYWIGWLQRKKLVNLKPVVSLGLLVAVVLLSWINFKTTEIPQREYITYGSYCSLITGEAISYHQDYLARTEILNSDEAVAELDGFRVHPFPFWTYDISEDPTDWKNIAVANWYNKESVVLKIEQ